MLGEKSGDQQFLFGLGQLRSLRQRLFKKRGQEVASYLIIPPGPSMTKPWITPHTRLARRRGRRRTLPAIPENEGIALRDDQAQPADGQKADAKAAHRTDRVTPPISRSGS